MQVVLFLRKKFQFLPSRVHGLFVQFQDKLRSILQFVFFQEAKAFQTGLLFLRFVMLEFDEDGESNWQILHGLLQMNGYFVKMDKIRCFPRRYRR